MSEALVGLRPHTVFVYVYVCVCVCGGEFARRVCVCVCVEGVYTPYLCTRHICVCVCVCCV